MSIITDANYVKLNYKNSENTYENLTPKIFVNGVGYNSNSIAYQLNRNNIASTNVADAITEIEGRVAQCGRKFDELEFGVGKDIDLLDNAENQITLDTYYIGNIVYFPKTQKYYMLLYSFTYSRSVLLSSNNGLSWQLDSDSSDTKMIYIDMKCNSQYLCFVGYNIYNYMAQLRYSSATYEIFANMYILANIFNMNGMPRSQYDLSEYFRISFDMDENSILLLSNRKLHSETVGIAGYRINITGNISQIYISSTGTVLDEVCFPKVLNINPGQYVCYVRGKQFNPVLISIAQNNVAIKTSFPNSNIYNDILLTNEFACTNLYEALFARTDDRTGLNSELKYIIISNPKDIKIESSDLFAPPILLAKKCCNNYVFYTSAFRGQSTNRKWAYLSRYLDLDAGRTVSLNDNNGDNIGDNYIIATGFNPSFINKINDKLFIYTNNEVNSTTLNNSKLYISQIKI